MNQTPEPNSHVSNSIVLVDNSNPRRYYRACSIHYTGERLYLVAEPTGPFRKPSMIRRVQTLAVMETLAGVLAAGVHSMAASAPQIP